MKWKADALRKRVHRHSRRAGLHRRTHGAAAWASSPRQLFQRAEVQWQQSVQAILPKRRLALAALFEVRDRALEHLVPAGANAGNRRAHFNIRNYSYALELLSVRPSQVRC